MNKIHVVEFTSGTTAKTITGLFQWNFGQILQIKGLDLPSAVEVHFALRRSGEAIRRIGVTKDGVTEVEIPDVLFKTMMTSDYDIYAYVYVSDEEYGSTTHEIVMKVKSRPMPEDIQNDFDEIMKAVKTLADGKVDKNQGIANNGKLLGVVDGYVVLVDAPSGGSDFPAQPLSSIMTFDSTAYYHINVDDIPDGYTYYYNDCCLDSSNLQLITFKKDGYDDVSNVMYSSDKLPFLISKVQSGALHVTLYSRDGYMNITYSTDGTVTKGDYVQYISKSEVLSKYNTTEYTPTEDYHPTTKKYVDDKAPLIVTFTGTGTEENPWTCNVTYEEIMTAISVGRSVEYYAENLLYNSDIVAIKAQLIPSNDDWYTSIILRIIDSNWLIGYDADNNIFVEKYQKLVSFDDLSNKPFYEYTDYEVLASIVCESEESSCEVGADFLEEGKTYHVAINTEEDIDGYDVLCSSYVNATYGLFCNYLGDTTPTGLAKNSEYGFIIYKENASDDIYIILDTDRYTLPCEVVICEPVTKVKTLDEKYLPDDVMKRSEFIMNWEDIENRPFYTYDGWKSVLNTTVESASTTISTSENLLEEGVTYCVDWENNDDGDSYKFECMYYHNATMGADVYYLGGNPVTETAATSDNGIIIYQNSSTDTITILVDETTISLPCAITISKLVEKVKTLDDVFIPQDVLRARAMDFTDDEKEIARNNIDAASTQDIEDHNSSSTSHADIRELITSLQNQISELTSKISTLEQKTIALTDDGEGNVTIS